MSKILILKGLPASGKSTFAKKLVEEGGWKRVNKDDLRAMLDNSKWSHDNEKAVVDLRNYMITTFLDLGWNVVVDDTNINPRHIRDIQMIPAVSSNMRVASAITEIKFFDVDVEECIRRDDERRENGGVAVGEAVIRKMAKQLANNPEPRPMPIPTALSLYEKPLGKPEAIICDIDGTLAHMSGRSPFEWHKVGEDEPDDTVAKTLSMYREAGYKIILLSGRDEVCRPETENWLDSRALVEYDALFMRAKDDNRKDSIIKAELFDEHVRNNYRVEFILDDRNQVVKMWRELGVKVYQVADGDF